MFQLEILNVYLGVVLEPFFVRNPDTSDIGWLRLFPLVPAEHLVPGIKAFG